MAVNYLKLLIYGLKEPMGGIEQVVLNYTKPLCEMGIECIFLINQSDTHLQNEIKKSGGKVLFCPSRKSNFLGYKAAVNSIFKKHRFDAVWCNLSGLTNIQILKLAKKHDIPVRICHSHTASLSHSGIFMFFIVPLLHFAGKQQIEKYATHFWGCSKKACEFMFPKSIQHKTKIINNAISTKRFYPDKTLRNKTHQELKIEDFYVVGHIARMCKEKNQEFLLNVFSRFLEKNRKAKLLFIGDGELKQKLLGYAQKLNITQNIIFLGEKRNTEKYYNAFDVFCLPSLNEGFGMTLIEAQACGVPCVASDTIPKESDISGCVNFLPLNADIDAWCKALENPQKIISPRQCVINSGYALENESRKLYLFFKEGFF